MSSSLEQLQVVVAEVQAARQQVSSVRAQAQELANTIEAVKAQPDDLSLHRQLGGVLVEVGDRTELLSELEASQEALATHLKRFEEREQQLVATYDELKRSLKVRRNDRINVVARRRLGSVEDLARAGLCSRPRRCHYRRKR